MTKGGDAYPPNPQIGSKNGRALLNEDDVKYIRECYNAHIPFKTVYEEYKNKISKRGLQNIWWFRHWKNICPEYCTEQNKEWHAHQAKANPAEIASQNYRAFTKEEVINMRQMYNDGLSIKNIQMNCKKNVKYSTIYNIIKRITYKDI